MFQKSISRRRGVLASLLLIVLILFSTSGLARSHYSYYRDAETRIYALTGQFYFEKNVTPLCEDCQKAANKYNDIVHKMNIFVRLVHAYRTDYLKGAKQIAAQKGELGKLKRQRADEKQIGRLERSIANNENENNHLIKMVVAHKKNYEKLNTKRAAAMSALKACEYKNCLKLSESKPIESCKECVFFATNYNTILKGVDSIRNQIARNEILEAHLKRDLARLNHLDSQEKGRHRKERSRSRIQSRAREKAHIKKRLSKLKSDRISLNTSLQRELTRLAEAKTALEDCQRKRCPDDHSYMMPPPVNGSTTNGEYAINTHGGFSLGVLGTDGFNDRDESFVSPVNNGSNDALSSGTQSHTMDGVGVVALMQYAFMSHPALFLYGMYGYPGDHDGTAYSGSGSNASTAATLRVFKHYSLAIGLAYTLLHYNNNSLALGLGMAAINQSLTARIQAQNNETMTSTTNVTSLAPHLLLEALIPVHQRIALMFGLSAAYLPNTRVGGVNNNGEYFFRLHQGIEWSLMFGLKFALFS